MDKIPFQFSAMLQKFQMISAAINRLDPGDTVGVQAVLDQIVSGAASAAEGMRTEIYLFNAAMKLLENSPAACSEGEGSPLLANDHLSQLAALSIESQQRAAAGPEQDDVPAAACFPLAVNREMLGVLCAQLSGDQPLTGELLTLLAHFADLAAMALAVSHQSLQAQQEQARKERELRRLRRAAMIISSRSNLQETLDAILEVALDITDAIYGVFRLVDRSGDSLVCMAISGIGLEKPAVEALRIDGPSIMATVAARREPVVVSDLREEPWRHIYYPLDHELEMRSEVAVPLIGASGRLEGVLNLESPQVAAFDKQDRYILQTLASQAVVAIQEARLLDALQEISLMLPHQPRQVIYQSLVERACDLLNTPNGIIWLLEKDQLVCCASTDLQNIGMRIGVHEGLAGIAIQEVRPVATVSGISDSFPDLPGYGMPAAALAVPIFANPVEKPLGVFAVHTAPSDSRDFSQSDWDKKVLDILGHYTALAAQLAEQQEALRVAQDQRALTEAFAAIGDIAANLLHRLNNKIGTIPVRIEGIQDKSGAAIETDPYLARNLDAIQRSAIEAMEIVHESLFHLHPVQLAPVSAAASIHQALASSQIPGGIQVELDALDKLPPVQADSTRLAMVFHNLIENAVDAMDGQGRLRISGAVEDHWVCLRVADDGPGIKQDLHERIFEFNYSARARHQPGRLGFGLWWVKSLMARFGGSVTVESDGKHGTTFLLTLPLAKENTGGTLTKEQTHGSR